MRTIALSATVCGLVVAVAGITVGNDLEMLLEDLSFGDDTSSVVKEAEAFQPDDSGFFMPGTSVPQLAMQQEPEAGDLTLENEAVAEEGQIDFEAAFQTQEQGAAEAAIVPPTGDDSEETLVQADAPAPLQDTESLGSLSDPVMIDGDNPTPQPMTDAPTEAMPISTHAAPVVNPHFQGHHAVGGAHSYGHYGGVNNCQPHPKPNLPTSTFYQYFGSDPCYANVWDGYYRKCPNWSHFNSNLDCLHKSNCGDCDSCDR